jgi:hypothetical protein
MLADKSCEDVAPPLSDLRETHSARAKAVRRLPTASGTMLDAIRR